MSEPDQTCSSCGATKAADDFHLCKGYRRKTCRACVHAVNKRRHAAVVESRIARCLAVLAEFGALSSPQLHDALPDIPMLSIAGAMNVAAKTGRCRRQQLSHPCRIEWSTLDHKPPPRKKKEPPKYDWQMTPEDRHCQRIINDDNDAWFANLQRDVAAKRANRGNGDGV